MNMFKRILTLEDSRQDSLFLWGARQTGKSTLLKELFPEAPYYDLLLNDVFIKLKLHPEKLRQECEMLPSETVVIIDEVQKLPELLDEVHWLISNKNIHFILCGSSARKLMRCGANLLGGRALRETLFPLVSAEIPDFDLMRALNNGMLPRHYSVADARRRIQSYVGDYLQQEIIQEAIVRNLNSFTRFLQVAAISDTCIVNYNRIAEDCGVSSKTVKEYFAILQETLIGFFVPSYSKVMKRRVIQSPKFYYFDVSLPNYMLDRMPLKPMTVEFGMAFEHFIMQEIHAYLGYSHSSKELSYWHTLDNRYEVDAIIGNAEVAIEIKSGRDVESRDTKGLKAFLEEYPDAMPFIVSMDEKPKLINNIPVYPATTFLQMLWRGDVVK
jgi:predicted AAA+ superfamily ATPase